MTFAPPPFRSAVPVRINLFSDTQTRPSRAMKEAMMDAPVGDEQHGDDPTINALCERMAALMGKEDAMFLPSGTMCNQIAILGHCRPGDEIIAHHTAHILTSEGGAPGALAGAMIYGLQGAEGQFSADAVRDAIRPKTRHSPPQSLLAVEQTANMGGGSVWTLDALNAVAEVAHEKRAGDAYGRGAADECRGRDGRAGGGDGGAVRHGLAGLHQGAGGAARGRAVRDAGVHRAAWRWKQRMGGALRQGGICAAACLYSLDHNVDRLAEDHDNAKALARGLAQVPGLTVRMPETNLVYIDTSRSGMDAAELARRAADEGVLISTTGRHMARACTHLDVTAAQVDEAAAVIRAIAA